MDCELFDETAFARNQELINDIFPDARFEIAFMVEDFDRVLSHQPVIFVKCAHHCYCYSTHPRQSEYIPVRNTTGKGICLKDAIKALVDVQYDPNCGHYFLEAFVPTKDSGVQFEARFGT